MPRRPIRKLSTMESFEYRRLIAILRRVRWRWRLKILLRGVALLLVSVFVAAAAGAWLVDAARYQPWVVALLGLLTYGAIGAAAYVFVVRPLSRKVTDRQVALYVEENAELRAALVSAVEFGALHGGDIPDDVSRQFVEKVVSDAVRRGRRIDYGKQVERTELQRVGGYVVAAAAFIALVMFINPAFLRHGLPALFRPFAGADVETPYVIAVVPGTTDIARGSDQVIAASLSGFSSDQVELSYRIGEGEWERSPMTPNEENGRHEYLLFRVAGDVEYFIEAAAVRSDVHRLTVVDRPHVARIDVDLEFPAYSGLPAQRIEDGGDIAALAGTVARLSVVPTVPVPEARLVLELLDADPRELPLETAEAGFAAELRVTEPGFYRIELRTPGGDWVDASSDYIIEVLSDQPPLVEIERPGRDTEVTSVDEVFAEATARDDFGLTALELVWSLNGGEEQRVALFQPPDDSDSTRQEALGSHTFYLEEHGRGAGRFHRLLGRGGGQPNGRRGSARSDGHLLHRDQTVRAGVHAGGRWRRRRRRRAAGVVAVGVAARGDFGHVQARARRPVGQPRPEPRRRRHARRRRRVLGCDRGRAAGRCA